jgi:hypothetical protein
LLLLIVIIGAFYYFWNKGSEPVDSSSADTEVDTDHHGHGHSHDASDDRVEERLSSEMKAAINEYFEPKAEPMIRDLPGGGKAVNISDRFRHVPVAVIGEDGQVRVREYNSKIEDTQGAEK